jgi:hypothetical protein
MNVKIAGAIAAIVAVLALTFSHKSSSATQSYQASVKEYDCSVGVPDDPRAFQGQVLATVSITCPTPPRATVLTVILQYRAKNSMPWQDAGQPKVFTGLPGAKATTMNVNQPCQTGNWRAAYTFSGTGAATGGKFVQNQAFGNSVAITADQCVNS